MQAKIEALRNELKQHNNNYYGLDAPTISDYDYDMKMKELEALESHYPQFADPTSPSVCVGHQEMKAGKTVLIQLFGSDGKLKDEREDDTVPPCNSQIEAFQLKNFQAQNRPRAVVTRTPRYKSQNKSTI